MDDPSKRIARFLILFIFVIVILKGLSGAGFLEAKEHKAKGYLVKIPEGWSKVKKEKGAVYPQGVEFVQFIPKKWDKSKIVRPEATISIYSKKLVTPIWIEDEFPDIVHSLSEAGFMIKDQGEIKMDAKISAWVVYYDRKTPALNLEFYIVSDNNMFHKIQYSADPDKFQEYRNSFEELRSSFKFRFALY